MSFLLWYFPITTFFGACDFAFSMGKPQAVGERPADGAERMHEPDDLTFDRFELG
jgi:hypothetical protein